ncbi:uncharacterized protein LOC127834197 [Dreissena polymorpha]|uniref:uncharacterized protein LOC127834197 n=1 Tax=Dreissena polymorpha TaxID=45954 RepID=UPI002263ED08|nr:uncharacterized protein LOC127834197 [Dreissena polymorpha]
MQKNKIIGRIDLVTLKNRVIYSKPRAHFSGLALLDGYLYVTDWFRKYVTRLNINGGNTLEQIGPSKCARLNGVAGFKKSTVKTVFSKCLQSDCSNLCLPVSDSDYKCACSDEEKNGIIPCTELNEFHRGKTDSCPESTSLISIHCPPNIPTGYQARKRHSSAAPILICNNISVVN